jgi:hypothetical protein
MKIRYHLDRKDDGLLILETEPQVRTMFIYSQNKDTMRVPLPHLIFVVRYIKTDTGFKYPGVAGSGLFVYGKFTPLNKISDGVVYLPTDKNRFGQVCTKHSSDNRIYGTINDLVNRVLTLWFSHVHYLEYDPFLSSGGWSNASLENLSKGDWLTVRNFHQFFLETTLFPYGDKSHREIPENAELIDAVWPIELEISLRKKENPPLPFQCNCRSCRAQRNGGAWE